MEKVLGKEHPYTLGSMNNLVGLLESQGKYNKVEQLLVVRNYQPL